jgi:NTE family protein
MNNAPSSAPHAAQRALVLGGGGATGNAWLIGTVAGLADAGLDVTTADLTIGTSAGATAAAQLAGASAADLLAATISAVPAGRNGPARSAVGRTANRQVSSHLERFTATIAASTNLGDMRRRTGAVALEGDAVSDDAWQKQWRATVGSRLPGEHWPERRVLITAVDAGTGEPVAFDRESGVELVDAVAASCAGGGISYRIDGRRYIDGGYRSNPDNVDLAAGCGRVLVLSPLSGRSLYPREWGTHLADQVRELRSAGSRVETVFPEPGSEHLFGAKAMDLSLRPAAAQVGFDQGRALAGPLAAFWG